MNKFLDKIPVDQVYEDLFKPGLKKAGESLATVLDLSNSILLPIKLLNEKSRILFSNNMKRYQKKLDEFDEKELISVPEYVGIPILDKLTYLSEENISEAFINLLVKASTEKTLKLVHPAFISTLNDLSSDEAKVLFYLKDKDFHPFIDIYIIRELEKVKEPKKTEEGKPNSKEELKQLIDYNLQDRQTTKLKSAWNLTGLEHKLKLDFPENIDLYLNNLERQKIIEFDHEKYSSNLLNEYEELTKIYSSNIVQTEEVIKEQLEKLDNEYILNLYTGKGLFEFTDYGKTFIKACMTEVKNEVQ